MSIASALVDFLTGYDTKKQVELLASRTYPRNRMFKKTFDLSSARTIPESLGYSFVSFIVGDVYSTAAPETKKSGTMKVFFDTPDQYKIQGALSFGEGFNMNLKMMAYDAFFLNDAQADTSMDIYFFADAEATTGTTRTQITGTIAVQNTLATALYNRPPNPTAGVRNIQTGAGTTTYTVPAGKVARVRFSNDINNASCAFSYKIDTNVVCSNQNITTSAIVNYEAILFAGQTASITLTGVGNAYMYAEEYAI